MTRSPAASAPVTSIDRLRFAVAETHRDALGDIAFADAEHVRDAFRSRYRQVAVAGGVVEETIYVAGLFERVTPSNGPVQHRHYLPGGNGYKLPRSDLLSLQSKPSVSFMT